MTSLDRTKALTEIWVAWLSVCAAILGGLFAGHQYLEHKMETRIQATLDFVARYQGDVVHEAQTRISTAWRKAQTEEMKILNTKAVTDTERKAKNKLWSEFVQQTIAKHDLYASIETLMDYFTALSVCVNRNICDATSAYSFFGYPAKNFYERHFVHIGEMREAYRDARFGRDIERFAKDALKYNVSML